MIKDKLRLTIGTLAFISLFADSIQIVEFFEQFVEMIKEPIKWVGIAICFAMIYYPISSKGLATYAG